MSDDFITEAPAGSHTELPWIAMPSQHSHGETTYIGRKGGEFAVCIIQSACWDPKAKLKFPEDRLNMKLILRAVNNIDAVTALLQEAFDRRNANSTWSKRTEAALKKARRK